MKLREKKETADVLTEASCAILFAISDVLEYRIIGLRFNAKKTADIPSTIRSQNCCNPDGSTTAGSIYMWFAAIFNMKW